MPNLLTTTVIRALCLVAPILALTVLRASAAEAAPKKRESEWVFSLLPKSLQKNPRLELTVITEMTEAGRKLPPASPGAPAYFESFASGYQARGEVANGEVPYPEKEITALLMKSLAGGGYLPAKRPEHPPSLMIFYSWGSHNLLYDPDAENPSLSPNAIAENVLSRAKLVGGQKFADQLRRLFVEANDMATLNSTPPPDPTGTVPAIEPVMGAAQMQFMNPVQRFKSQSDRNEFLVDQTVEDVYYVVASAYDYRSVAAQKPVLLWRTSMTVAASGVSQDQTVPVLVAAASPYFGKEMTEPEILTRRAVPDGKVEIGVPTVVEGNERRK